MPKASMPSTRRLGISSGTRRHRPRSGLRRPCSTAQSSSWADDGREETPPAGASTLLPWDQPKLSFALERKRQETADDGVRYIGPEIFVAAKRSGPTPPPQSDRHALGLHR